MSSIAISSAARRAVDDRRVHELVAQDVVPELLGREGGAADGVAHGELLDRGLDRLAAGIRASLRRSR